MTLKLWHICICMIACWASAPASAHTSMMTGKLEGEAPFFAEASQEDMKRAAPTLWVQSKISAREAKSIALSRVPNGEVVDISKKGNRYRVRIIQKNGRVVDVYVDATTGRISS